MKEETKLDQEISTKGPGRGKKDPSKKVSGTKSVTLSLEEGMTQTSGRKSASKKGRDRNESPGPSGLSYFDPAALVKTREGTFKAPKAIKHYLEKHLRRCLSKEEREALHKEDPLPDIDACVPPKVDKYLSDFLGTQFPTYQDSKLSQVQGAVIAIARPVVAAWQKN